MSFVERSIILCPYLGGSTIGGSTVTICRILIPLPCTSLVLGHSHNFDYVYSPSIEQVPVYRQLVVLSPDMSHDFFSFGVVKCHEACT